MTKTASMSTATPKSLTTKIVIAMALGTICGLIIKILPTTWQLNQWLIDGLFNVGGTVFINLLKMIIVPLVTVSLLCGICSLDDIKKLGSIGIKSIGFFILTTVIAIILAITTANILHIGSGINFPLLHSMQNTISPSLQQVFIDIFPTNFFQALVNANILQIIVFTIIFGIAINLAGEPGKRIAVLLNDLNIAIMKVVELIMHVTPYGVFCLIAILFAKLGLEVILPLLNYFITVILVLALHTLIVYSSILKFVAKLSPIKFFKKMYGVMLFAFSISSSNASLPLTMDTVERKLGVDNAVASFVLSLGINMNKNGSAIMQGVAAIFIANSYNINIGFAGNALIVITATLASIGTAGVPSVGVLALAMVLKQVGLPLEGIALILAIDRLIDMLRTAVNVTGNAVIACVVGKNAKKIDLAIYNS